MLQRAEETNYININCVDPLGRSALLMAIDNENLEMVELLIEHKVETKDALLHAISEEFVEAVEVLLDHEETLHKPGEPHVSMEYLYSKLVLHFIGILSIKNVLQRFFQLHTPFQLNVIFSKRFISNSIIISSPNKLFISSK